MQGYALRVGGVVKVPPNPTDADIDAALAMMTPMELKRLGRTLSRQMRWSLWSLRHPWLAAIVEGAVASAAMMAR